MAASRDITGPPKARGPVKTRKAPPRSPAPPARKPAPGGHTRKAAQQVRRGAILKAALQVFAEHGFEAARLDDVAKRAGVAKGTLYLYFAHKQALFEALVRDAVTPVLDRLEQLVALEAVPATVALERLFEVFRTDVLGSDRKLVVRIILAEGARFPRIARFYHREVIARGLALLRKLLARAAATGEIASDAAARHPQLVVAPLLVAIVWDGMFSAIDPLDVTGLLKAHLELIAGKSQRSAA